MLCFKVCCWSYLRFELCSRKSETGLLVVSGRQMDRPVVKKSVDHLCNQLLLRLLTESLSTAPAVMDSLKKKYNKIYETVYTFCVINATPLTFIDLDS